MQPKDIIALTGAAGFIGSFFAGFLNRLGFENLVLVDDFANEKKAKNLSGKKYLTKVHREQFFDWTRSHPNHIKYMFHLGARTDTTEMDFQVLKKLNLDYSKAIWEFCIEENIPLLYASSAATYGNGELGYSDAHELIYRLQPLNPYGKSKNDFDIWALEQKKTPPFWAGVKFFNVYGPNEYHKARMASVVLHAFKQIKEKGTVKLFRSHHPDYRDGEQMRDFVYVEDVANMCFWLMKNQPVSGLYNVGSGKARTFKDLVHALFAALEKEPRIEYIDTPEDIRNKYQYFTEADMEKIKKAGYNRPFHSLEEGVEKYVKEFLCEGNYF